MTWAAVEWGYKALVASSKLAQMVENLRVHDHRPDGTQGAALVGAWSDVTGLAEVAGWTITRARTRTVLTPKLLLVDVEVKRTGNQLQFNGNGNIADTTVLTGWPAALRPLRNAYLESHRTTFVTFTSALLSDGKIIITDGPGNAVLPKNESFLIGGLVWLD